MAKWLKIVIISILITTLLGLFTWFIFFSGILDKNKKYTYQDLQDMYNSGYAEGAANNAILQTRITTLEVQISNLRSIIAELNEENIRIPGLESDIETLQIEKQQLLARIEELESELLQYYNDLPDRVIVSFYVDNQLYLEYSIRKNGSVLLNVEEPGKVGYLFDGWSLNDNVIDITSHSFADDTRLDATFVLDTTLLTLFNRIDNSNKMYFEKLDNSKLCMFYNQSKLKLFFEGYEFDNLSFINNNEFIAICNSDNNIVQCRGVYSITNKILTINLNDTNYQYYLLGFSNDDYVEVYKYFNSIELSDYLDRMIVLTFADGHNEAFDFGYDLSNIDIDYSSVDSIKICKNISYLSFNECSNLLDNFNNVSLIEFDGSSLVWFGEHFNGSSLIKNFDVNLQQQYIVRCADGEFNINSNNKVLLKFYAPGKLDGFNITFEKLIYHVACINKNSLFTQIINPPSKPGYNFDGWSINDEIIDFLSFTFDEDAEIEACFSVKLAPNGTYKLYFDRNTTYSGVSIQVYGEITFVINNGVASIDRTANNYINVKNLTDNSIETYTESRFFKIANLNNVPSGYILNLTFTTIQIGYFEDSSVININYFSVDKKINYYWYYTSDFNSICLENI